MLNISIIATFLQKHIHISYMTTLILEEVPSAVEHVVDSKTSSAAVPYSIPSSDDNQLVASGNIE